MSRRVLDSSIPECDGCCHDCFVNIDTATCKRRFGLTVDDEIPKMSEEWILRIAGFDEIANQRGGTSWGFRDTKSGFSMSRLCETILTREDEEELNEGHYDN